MPLKTQKHSCQHCGAVYQVKRGLENGPRKYRTAVCTHCGDVMAEWEGRVRHYRRIKRLRASQRAAKLVNGIVAATKQLKQRERTRANLRRAGRS